MRIEDRVRLAFDLGLNRDFMAMLAIALPAIDESAKRKWKKGGKSGFLKFLRDNYDVLQWFSGNVINYSEMKFPTIDSDFTDNKTVERPDLAEIVYHVHRCCLAHGQDISANFGITPRRADGSLDFKISKDGKFLNLPESIAWGLLAAVVLDPVNSALQSRSGNYFTVAFEQNTYFLNVDLFWGAKATITKISSKYELGPDQTQSIMSQLVASSTD
jgi:hypothetical protein